MYVAIDYGYSHLKGISFDGAKVSFPSVVTEATGSGEYAKILKAKTEYRLSVKFDGQDKTDEYFVGDAGVQAEGVRSYNATATGRREYPLMVLAGLSALGVGEDIDLALGVPFRAYADKQERKALRKQITSLGATVALNGKKRRHISVGEVRVYPQGLGGYIDAISTPQGARLVGKPVGVVDLGGRTCDYVLMLPDGGNVCIPDEARSGSLDEGINQALQGVRQVVAERIGGQFDPPAGLIERLLAGDGIMVVGDKKIDLHEAYGVAVGRIARKVEDTLRQVWAQHLDYLAGIILIGGGGQAVAKHLTLPNVTLVRDPAYSNARGFLSLLVQQEVKSAKPLE